MAGGGPSASNADPVSWGVTEQAEALLVPIVEAARARYARS